MKFYYCRLYISSCSQSVYLSNSLSTSSYEKLRFIMSSALVISLVVSCSLRIWPSSMIHALLWFWWRSSTSCYNRLVTFYETISSLLSLATLSNFQSFSVILFILLVILDVVATSYCNVFHRFLLSWKGFVDNVGMTNEGCNQ